MKKLIVSLALVCAVSWFAGSVSAMGGPAPEDQYKLEILKVEIISGEATTEAEVPSVAGKKVLLVVAPTKFDDNEYKAVKQAFTDAEMVVTISSSMNKAGGVYGTRLNSDILLHQANAADYDAIVFIGGPGVTVYNRNPVATGLIAKGVKEGKVIGGLSLAPITLVNGRALVKGKKAAVSPYGKRALKGAGIICTGKPVETDGKVVTGSGPEAAGDFAQAVIDALRQ